MFKPMMTAAAVMLSLTLAGCGAGDQWRTMYQSLSAEQTAGWRVADVQVTAPASLTVSEENTYVPEADIVWHGERMGDRRAQAAGVIRDGIRAGAAGLNGLRPVTMIATVRQFHALTPRARALEGNVGVHDVKFDLGVADARTGEIIVPPQRIEADQPALVGTAAADADARGFGQRVEIVTHLGQVVRHWLGQGGNDPRGSFSRFGR